VLADVVLLPGYLALGYALVEMLRCRRAAADDPARADTLLITLTVAVATWAFLIEPNVGDPAISLTQQFQAFFPLADVLVLAIAIQLVIADGRRTPALWLLATGVAMMVAGDLGYAFLYYGDGSSAFAQPLLESGFLLAFAVMGAAALHPTMQTLTEPQPVVLRPFGRVRATLIVFASIVPIVIATVYPAPTPGHVPCGCCSLACSPRRLSNASCARRIRAPAPSESLGTRRPMTC
jgi:hypothetical protein